MKILWLVNTVLPGAARAFGLPVSMGGSWMGALLDALLESRASHGHEFVVLTPSPKVKETRRAEEEGISWIVTPSVPDYKLAFAEILKGEQAGLIHIHGTEYHHSYDMAAVCDPAKTVVSIQGLVGFYARHYLSGLPTKYHRRNPLKMAMEKIYAADVIADGKRDFETRGVREAELLRRVRHVIGRTRWDKGCCLSVNPNLTYHHCEELLRPSFYEAKWRYDSCKKHSILLSQANYPVKGAHRVLEQMPKILERYPDARLNIAGLPPYRFENHPGLQPVVDFFFEYQGYLAKLCRDLNLQDKVTWLGPLGETEMRQAYLDANVFICPSSIENSPNSVAEAMVLGAPVISSNVGGLADMLTDRREGWLYPVEESYLLPGYVERVFENPQGAEEMGVQARDRAVQRHEKAALLGQLLSVYRQVAGSTEFAESAE